MFWFESHHREICFPSSAVMPCTECAQQRPFRIHLYYTCFELFFIFGMVTHKRFVAACSYCARGFELGPAQTPITNPANPIPFMECYGMYILLASLAVLCCAALVLYLVT